ncbi:probable receptor-like protein kinase At2g42960 isoform X2 [Physcomitrium patens]|uniref:probable receptor-like protein kinase At2g42960 isoform X2 n=1 Tax=Physcomitrium patens TaxID=3218 RepID=UPI003CCD00FC
MARCNTLSASSELMHLVPLLVLLFTWPAAAWVSERLEVEVLMDVKAALDPDGLVLESWKRGGQPCSGSFEGIFCNSVGRVTNISLQGRSLTGYIPHEVSELLYLSGLFLHFNELQGGIPGSLFTLESLTDLYLNWNQLTGPIPPQIGQLTRLQALELCCNKLEGEIPVEITTLSNLKTLAINANSLYGTTPTTVGDLTMLQRFDLSNNTLIGRIPDSIANLTNLVFLDVSNNFLSGPVPTDVKLVQTSANSGEKAENISETTHHLRGSFNGSTPDFSTLGRSRVMSGRSTSTVASNGLSSPAEWNSWIHLDELETATNYFSEKNLLRKSCHSAVYQGVLRDGTVVAVKAIYNTRYSFGEQDFQNALEALLQVKHENLVNFLGFCCSKGGSECFLVYELVSCGSLEKNLHGPSEVLLNWSMRVNIIRGIAKGLAHLHEGITEPLTMVHQNLWAGNILLDKQGNALLADYGLSDIVAEEVMYATHKTLASLGYLAPEYAYTGQVTEDSDIYAFGALVLELLTGNRPMFFTNSTRTLVNTHASVRPLLDLGKIREFVDPKLEDNFSLEGAAGLAHIALQCMSEDPGVRPNMVDVVLRLNAYEGWSDMPIDSFLFTTTTAGARQLSFSRVESLHQCR